MPTRNVVVTDHQADLIDRLVASGRYQNASEAMRAGLRLLEEDENAKAHVIGYFDQLHKEAADPSQIVDMEGADVVRRAFKDGLARYDSKRGK